jgi:hypothetical protein
MIENVLSEISGIGLYGVVSICIFFATFCAATAWMFSIKKPYIQSMSHLPLEDEPSETKTIITEESNRHE